MRNRFAPGLFVAAVMLASAVQLASAAQPLPAFDMQEPAIPLEDFTSEAGWLARWRDNHRLRAERDGYIKTDRPSFTFSDSVVPRGWLQAETGWLYTASREIGTDYWSGQQVLVNESQHTLPVLNVRYGWKDWLELRVGWGGIQDYDGLMRRTSNGSHMREAQVTYSLPIETGIKLQTTQQNGLIPKSALMALAAVPVDDSSVRRVVPMLDYIYTWYLTPNWSFGGSSGAVFNTVWDQTCFFQSLILRRYFGPKFELFVEVFGIDPPLTNDNYYLDLDYQVEYNTGLLWRPLPNLQFDWHIGFPMTNRGYEYRGGFTGLGVSLRY